MLKGSVMRLQQQKNPSLKFSLLYSLWHKQTSTYALSDIDVLDILKCLTDILSLPQIFVWEIMPVSNIVSRQQDMEYIWIDRLNK